MNISGIVIKVREERLNDVLEELDGSDICEVHYHERNKIIVTIEGASTDEEIKKLKSIEMTKGVLSAEMVYAYSEKELEEERGKIEISDNVPDWLNDDNIKAGQIKYNGNIKI